MTGRPPGTWCALPSAAVLDGRLSAAELRTLALLCRYTDAAGECFPSVGLLAKLLRRSRQQVQRHLQELERAGYIKRRPRFCKTTGSESNLISVRYPAAPSTAPPATPDAALTNPVELVVDDDGERARPGARGDSSTTAAGRVVAAFLAFRRELWPNESALPAPTMTLEAHTKAFLLAGMPEALMLEVLDRKVRAWHASGKTAPNSIKLFERSLSDAAVSHKAASNVVTLPLAQSGDGATGRRPGRGSRAAQALAEIVAEAKERRP